MRHQPIALSVDRAALLDDRSFALLITQQ